MFGILKENILKNLENVYVNGSEDAFKKDFKNYIKILKENKSLRTLTEIYSLFDTLSFDTDLSANEFIEEAIIVCRTTPSVKSDMKQMEAIIPNIVVDKNSFEYKLDQLIFNENINLKDKVLFKMDIIKKLRLKGSDKEAIFENDFTTLNERINENVNALNDDDKIVLDLFMENDKLKISEFYGNLINEVECITEDKIVIAENSEIIKRLVEVKKKLNSLKDSSPTISEIEKIIALKRSFI